MGRRKLGEENVRNLQRSHRSYVISLPINLVRKFGWQEHQKLIVREYKNEKLIIEDWEE